MQWRDVARGNLLIPLDCLANNRGTTFPSRQNIDSTILTKSCMMFCINWYEGWNLQTTKYPRLWRRVTPEVTAAKQAEKYNIKGWNACSRSFNVNVLIKEGMFFSGKGKRFYENKGAFLGWNQCFSGIFKFW